MAARKCSNETAMSASKHRVYHKLQVASHRLQKAADRALHRRRGDHHGAGCRAVDRCDRGIGEPAQRLARKLGLNEFAMTAMTTTLCAIGLLDRLPDAADARAVACASPRTAAPH